MIRFGILGAGAFGEVAAAAIDKADGASLTAVFKRNLAEAQRFAEPAGARAYDDVDSFLADEAVDVVWVATPNAMHREHTLRALEAGKHALVEKPMALTVADAQSMRDEARGRGLVLGVGFHLRHHQGHEAVRQLLSSGGAGEPVLVQGLWGSDWAGMPMDMWQLDPGVAGVGSLAGLGVHLLDLIPWLLGRPVLEVVAQTDAEGGGRPIEFLASVLLRLAGDAFAQVISSRRLPFAHNDLVVYTSQARLTCRGTLGMDGGGDLEVEPSDLWSEPSPMSDPYRAQVEAFVRAVRDGAPFHASADDGVASVQLVEAVVESARTGRAVPIPEPRS